MRAELASGRLTPTADELEEYLKFLPQLMRSIQRVGLGSVMPPGLRFAARTSDANKTDRVQNLTWHGSAYCFVVSDCFLKEFGNAFVIAVLESPVDGAA